MELIYGPTVLEVVGWERSSRCGKLVAWRQTQTNCN